MSYFYNYSITGSFPSASVAISALSEQIENSSITGSDFLYINSFGDDVSVYFSASLDPVEVSVLDGLISIHDGSPLSFYGQNHEDFLVLDGSRPMSGNLDLNGNDINNVDYINGIDILSHASRHERTGSDPLDGDHIGIDFNPIYYVPNTSNPEATNPDDLSAHLAGIDNTIGYLSSSLQTVSFGKDFSYAESIYPFSTTNTSFQQAYTTNFSASSAGSYRFGWFYIWNHQGTNSDIEIRIQLDNSINLLYPYHRQEPQDPNPDQKIPANGFKILYLASGIHNVDFDIRSSVSHKESTIYSASLEVWKVS